MSSHCCGSTHSPSRTLLYEWCWKMFAVKCTDRTVGNLYRRSPHIKYGNAQTCRNPVQLNIWCCLCKTVTCRQREMQRGDREEIKDTRKHQSPQEVPFYCTQYLFISSLFFCLQFFTICSECINCYRGTWQGLMISKETTNERKTNRRTIKDGHPFVRLKPNTCEEFRRKTKTRLNCVAIICITPREKLRHCRLLRYAFVLRYWTSPDTSDPLLRLHVRAEITTDPKAKPRNHCSSSLSTLTTHIRPR